MTKTTIRVAILIAALPAAPATAQLSVSPYAGGMIYDGSLQLHEAGVFTASGIEDRAPVAVVGLRVGYEVTDRLGIEASYGRSWLENRSGDLASHLYQAAVRYSVIDTPRWDVHVGAGAGGITYDPIGADDKALSDAAISGLIGATYPVTSALDLRTDLGFLGQFCAQPPSGDGLRCNDGSQLGYTQLTAGLRLRL